MFLFSVIFPILINIIKIIVSKIYVANNPPQGCFCIAGCEQGFYDDAVVIKLPISNLSY